MDITVKDRCNLMFAVNAKLSNMQDVAREFALKALSSVEQKYKLDRNTDRTAFEIAGEILALGAMNLMATANGGKLEPICLCFDGVQTKDSRTLPTQMVCMMLHDEKQDVYNNPDWNQLIGQAESETQAVIKKSKRKGKALKAITPSAKEAKVEAKVRKERTTIENLQAQLDSQLAPEVLEAMQETNAKSVIATEAQQLQEENIEVKPVAMPVIDPVATIQNASRQQMEEGTDND